MTGLKRTPRSRGGFTLVELLCAIIVLLLLAALLTLGAIWAGADMVMIVSLVK